jgi:putative transposase
MANWRPEFDPAHLYFITTKAADYAHFFERDVMKRIILDALDSFRMQKRMRLYGFVIMPNHFHSMSQFSAEDPIADVMRDLKRHVSDRLIRQLKAEQCYETLKAMAGKVSRPDKQAYKVWEDGYSAKDVFSEDFLLQKMKYIHDNPCQLHWNLSLAPELYLWSSARFYLTTEPCIIPIDDMRKLLA